MAAIAKRKTREREYLQRILIVHEGEETENKYIQHVKYLYGIERKCRIEMYHPKHTSISAMIQKMNQEAGYVDSRDCFWIVLDRDEGNHKLDQFEELAQWEKDSSQHHVAISTPRFEYWLLLHVMEHPSGVSAKADNYVEQHIPGYTKDLRNCFGVFTKNSVDQAIERAETQGVPTCIAPDKVGSGVGRMLCLFKRVADNY